MSLSKNIKVIKDRLSIDTSVNYENCLSNLGLSQKLNDDQEFDNQACTLINESNYMDIESLKQMKLKQSELHF